MNIGKKAIFLTAAAGALVIGGAGSALAHDGYTGQTNHCDTATGVIASVGGAAPTGDINIGADCINYTDSGATYQGNDCDTATGLIAPIGAVAPTGDVSVGAKCGNIAVG